MLILARKAREDDIILVGGILYRVVSKVVGRKNVQLLLERRDKPDIKFTWVTNINNQVKLVTGE